MLTTPWLIHRGGLQVRPTHGGGLWGAPPDPPSMVLHASPAPALLR